LALEQRWAEREGASGWRMWIRTAGIKGTRWESGLFNQLAIYILYQDLTYLEAWSQDLWELWSTK
jgi:hypothetical protein